MLQEGKKFFSVNHSHLAGAWQGAKELGGMIGS